MWFFGVVTLWEAWESVLRLVYSHQRGRGNSDADDWCAEGVHGVGWSCFFGSFALIVGVRTGSASGDHRLTGDER